MQRRSYALCALAIAFIGCAAGGRPNDPFRVTCPAPPNACDKVRGRVSQNAPAEELQRVLGAPSRVERVGVWPNQTERWVYERSVRVKVRVQHVFELKRPVFWGGSPHVLGEQCQMRPE